MRTITLIVDADGRVELLDCRPGQTLTIKSPEVDRPTENALTTGAARTPEEKQAVVAGIERLASDSRGTAPRDWLEMHYDDWLYHERGLPK